MTKRIRSSKCRAKQVHQQNMKAYAAQNSLLFPSFFSAGSKKSGVTCDWNSHECPKQCSCSSGIVDCSRRGLTEIPQELPKATKHLLLADNEIDFIPAYGLFNRLPNLIMLDLSRNQISRIEDGAFEGAVSIKEM